MVDRVRVGVVGEQRTLVDRDGRLVILADDPEQVTESVELFGEVDADEIETRLVPELAGVVQGFGGVLGGGRGAPSGLVGVVRVARLGVGLEALVVVVVEALVSVDALLGSQHRVDRVILWHGSQHVVQTTGSVQQGDLWRSRRALSESWSLPSAARSLNETVVLESARRCHSAQSRGP